MFQKILASCVALTCLVGAAAASTIVLDSFNEGGHTLAAGGDTAEAQAVSSPFGSKRVTTITRVLPTGATLTSTLTPASGTVEFHVVGAGFLPEDPRVMRIHYSDGGPFSLVGYSAMELDVAVIAGTGNLIFELGSASDSYGPETKRIPITAGTITVPFGELNFGPTGSLESFQVMHFVFEATSDEYSLLLHEIRVVPEPANLMFIAAAGGMSVLVMRRRQRCPGTTARTNMAA
jgi:hypothetical protein